MERGGGIEIVFLCKAKVNQNGNVFVREKDVGRSG